MVVRGWSWAGVALCGLSLLRFALHAGATGRSTKAFLSAARYGAEGGRGAVGLESYQQSDIKSRFKLFITEDFRNKQYLK